MKQKTRPAIGALIVFLGCLPLEALGELNESVYIQVPRANLREKPSTSSGVVASAEAGDELEVIDRKGKWLQVAFRGGRRAWIRGDLVSDRPLDRQARSTEAPPAKKPRPLPRCSRSPSLTPTSRSPLTLSDANRAHRPHQG